MKIATIDNRNEIQAQIDILKLLEGSTYNIDEIIDQLEQKLSQLTVKKFKFYRLRHKPSGLFYTRSRYMSSQIPGSSKRKLKSNMSAKGKVYHQKPQVPRSVYTHIPIDGMFETLYGYCIRTKETDWEIVGYE